MARGEMRFAPSAPSPEKPEEDAEVIERFKEASRFGRGRTEPKSQEEINADIAKYLDGKGVKRGKMPEGWMKR